MIENQCIYSSYLSLHILYGRKFHILFISQEYSTWNNNIYMMDDYGNVYHRKADVQSR